MGLASNFLATFLLLSPVVMIIGPKCTAAEYPIVTATHVDISGGLQTALDEFSNDCSRYPTTAEGFAALMQCPTNISEGRWHGPYFNQIPKDPWGRNYVYRCPGIHHTNSFDLYSCGFDGISKTGGEDPDDINNWDPSSPHGGNDAFLNYRELLLHKILNWPGMPVLWPLLVIISFVGGIQLIASISSLGVRACVKRHPVLYVIWFMVSLGAFLLLYLYASLHPYVGR